MTLKSNRQIARRWIIEGDLELLTPTSLSNGDPDPLVDLPIVVDPLEGRALLTGASLAGALRSHVGGYDLNYAEALFGGRRGDKKGTQSALIVEDALGGRPDLELRDGVSINPQTRTAKDDEKYDRQLLAAGTTFKLGFELVLLQSPAPDDTTVALALALRALQEGHIRLGGRKRRGYGECRARRWRAWDYSLTDPDDLRHWLEHGRRGDWKTRAWSGEDILEWSPLHGLGLPRSRADAFSLEAEFEIDGSVLIRSGFELESAPDAAHLRSRRNGQDVPVLSGTSLGGVIRAQSLRIARTLAADGKTAERFIDDLFGYMPKPQEKDRRKQASRMTVGESAIGGSYRDLVQSRVRIDRFTGGASETALFTEQPLFGGGFRLSLSVARPTDADVGLLLLVLKDLWTGFTPVGGEASVGRGRLRGRSATIRYGDRDWRLEHGEVVAGNGASKPTLRITPAGGHNALQDYVMAFQTAMGRQDGPPTEG